MSWLMTFSPFKFLSKNGLLNLIKQGYKLGEAFHIQIMTMAIESAWLNCTCECFNGIIVSRY